MKLRIVTLGNTRLKVSRLCIGTDYADIYGRSPLGREILLKSFSLGVNFWDTSESYGSYPAIREALKTLDRSKVVITSKSYSRNVDGAKKDLEDALREIETDYLDIFMLHAVDTLEDFNARREVLNFLLECKRKSIIRAVGVSTHSARVALALAEIPEIEVVLAVLNMRGFNIKDGDLQLMHSAIKKLYNAGKGVYLMKVLARGKLAEQAEEALTYVFKIPYVHAISVGIKNLRELETAVKIENKVDETLRCL
ncbi:aldo/keto reductase [Candidatus Bathyarchaeota archaeon]|nr:aldo/keto reductase [Candidatus Bathyarchaeota archaeon]